MRQIESVYPQIKTAERLRIRTILIFCISIRVNRVAGRMVGEHRICGILIANLIKCAAGPQHRREGQLRRYQQGVIN